MKTISRLLASALILVFSLTAARAINPQKEYTYTPKDFGIEYIEDSVVTSDGYRINIWNLPGTEENGRSVLIACADAGNMGQWLGIGATLCFLGYDVWMFDYRGFGGSQDFATDRDRLYHSEYLRDFGAVLEHVAVLRDRPVDVLAFSMGKFWNMSPSSGTGRWTCCHSPWAQSWSGSICGNTQAGSRSSGAASWTGSSPIRRRASGF